MHKTAINFALRYQFRLGRDHNGYYTLRDAAANVVDMSYFPTARSAIKMMQRHVRRADTTAIAGAAA